MEYSQFVTRCEGVFNDFYGMYCYCDGLIEGYSSIALYAKVNTRGNVDGSAKLAISEVYKAVKNTDLEVSEIAGELKKPPAFQPEDHGFAVCGLTVGKNFK